MVPEAGAKGFFSRQEVQQDFHWMTCIPLLLSCSPFRALEKKLIGGVTLNHLCWAALGGVRAGLLALQGNDELGRLIRRSLRNQGVATDFIASETK